jgi:hypothetical protein
MWVKELTVFKLYAWQQSAYHTQRTFDEFFNNLVSDELLAYYKKTVLHYRQVPSYEIWTENTIDHTLKLIEYFYETGHFAGKETPLLLCEQYLELIDTINLWTEDGIKNKETRTPFRLYLSNFIFESSLLLLKHDHAMQCSLKLFTINSLTITDQPFCRETYQWLNHLIKRSVLVCGASEKDRYLFFNGQKQKIRFLIDKIYHQNS